MTTEAGSVHVLKCTHCGIQYCSRSSVSSSILQLSTHTAQHSKALLKLNLKLILPLFYLFYVAEAVDGGEDVSFLTYKQT